MIANNLVLRPGTTEQSLRLAQLAYFLCLQDY